MRQLILALFLFTLPAHADSVVVFNEIQYHPAAPAEPEWIELHNQMTYDVDLSQWRLRGGVDFDFPLGTIIPAGGHLVVSDNPAALGVPGALGPWAGRLANGGDLLRLRNNSGRLMNEVEFTDSGLWPIGADGSGATLAKSDEGAGSSDAGNWRASAQLGGTPGAENFPDDSTIGPAVTLFPIDATWRYNESGADLGAGWANSAHPAWSSGAGLLGFETSPGSLPEAIGTTFADPADNDFITYYFEIEFELSAVQVGNIASLTMRHVTDDGAVFYLNGTEVGPRFNMDAGAVTAATTSSTSVGNAAYSAPVNLPTGALVTGTNRLSVEVHQQGTDSSDIIFGAELSMTQAIAPPSSLESPLVLSEISGTGDADFRIELANLSAGLVSLDGLVIASRGTVDASYTIPDDTTIAADGFLVITEAELGFRPANDDRLFLLSPAGGTQALVHAARADDLPRAYSTAHDGKMLVPATFTFGAANAFDFNPDIVINEIMYHFREDPGNDGSGEEQVLIPIGASWRYNESGADLGAGWQASAHLVDNVSWFSGAALLGSETSPASLPETLNTIFAPSADNDIVTYYFETDFDLTAEQHAGISEMRLRHVIDDGAVFYLNGVEVERYNLPAGAVSASTPASPGVPNANYVGPITLPLANLIAGTNRLSVEVHQQFPSSSDIVFGAELVALAEVPPVPIVERDEEWIELFNRGAAEVILTGWSIDGGIDYNFPAGTSIPAGGFLVVAKDSVALKAKYPAIAGRIVGDYSNRLSNTSDRIRVEDAVENPVDEVLYFEGGRWPGLADGNGSSLELRDPDADNSNAQAWAASDESGKSTWQTISYRDNGAQSYGLTNWNEFRLGMQRAGEVLIDDVSVVRDPDGVAQELIQDGSFSAGGTKWRLIGNHRHSVVIAEPGNAGNQVLHLAATGPTDTRHNHLETTFLPNSALSSGQIYEVSFRARWLSGSNSLNSRAYYQRLAKTTQLARPENCGTPGAPNSQLETNIGPTFSNLRHDPPVPTAGQSIEISADVSDPDGLGSFVLQTRFDEGAVQPFNFVVDATGHGVGTFPAPPAGTVIQFWIEATDALGEQSFAPAGGADSRALIQVDDGQGTGLAVAEIRLIMLDSDRDFMLGNLNLMSNERLGGTAIYDRREIFYDARVRLRGSEAGRARDGQNFRGFNIGLPADQKFRGVHDSLSIDRSARTPTTRQQHEIYVKHMFNRAGVPCMYDELVYLVGPATVYNGTSQMLMAGYGGLFTSTQFDNGGNGSVFNLDITYDPVSTVDGNPESLKPPVPFTHIGTDMRDLGDSEEDYRTSFEIRTGRRRDDYSGLINFCKMVDQPSAQLEQEIGEWMDVDEWCRYTALTLLCGIGDTFVSGGLRHNIRFFVPEDGRGVKALPWDMDFVFSSGTNSSMLPGGGNLGDVIAIPKYRRLYWGHVHDLVSNTFNTTYMAPWLSHYGGVLNQNFSAHAGYISSRGSFALTQIPAQMPFSITTNGGNDFTVDTTLATLEGQGWVNVREFRLAGREEVLAVEWLDADTWRLQVPVLPGANPVDLEVFDFQGSLIHAESLVITSTATEPQPVDFLRITELNYNPDGDDGAEFVELKNIGVETLDIGGANFTDGIAFTIPSGTMLAPGAFALVVHNRVSFESVYGVGLPVVGEYSPGNLRNSDERVELRDASGNVIHEFTYFDHWYPATDGGGYTLVVRDESAAVAMWDTPAGWGISGELGGNPGADNSAFAAQFEGWQRDHFSAAELADAAISGPDAVLNSSGTPNLIKYAFGLDPRAVDPPGGAPFATVAGERLRLTFRRQKIAVDLTITPQASIDLEVWRPLTAMVGVAIDNGDGTETVTFEDTGADPALGRNFGRVRVELNPP